MGRAGGAAVVIESPIVDRMAADHIDHFVASTRQALFVRRADNLLLIRPDKTLSVNDSALEILQVLYERDAPGAADILPALASELRVDLDRLTHDTLALINAVGKILNENYEPDDVIRMGHFDRGIVQFPTLAEIALTYGCQNRCSFCYASSPYRKDEHRLMTTVEVTRVMDRIFHQGHVPSLSFTGGEDSGSI